MVVSGIMREAFMPAACSRSLSPEAAGLPQPDCAGDFPALIEPSALHEFHALLAAADAEHGAPATEKPGLPLNKAVQGHEAHSGEARFKNEMTPLP